jgi:hypothetical protein
MNRFLLVLSVFAVSTSTAFAFGPCMPYMPTGMSYLPSVPVCNGKAAIVLSGKYFNSFSAVVRDCNNNDRDPCHTNVGSCGTNASSPFKVQAKYEARIKEGKKTKRARINCLKEAGDSYVYRLVRRITVKLRNPARLPSDIAKVCLKTRTKAVRPVEILSTWGGRSVLGLEGYTPACRTQGYLDCSLAYADICPTYNWRGTSRRSRVRKRIWLVVRLRGVKRLLE